jgi:hypothetical protein
MRLAAATRPGPVPGGDGARVGAVPGGRVPVAVAAASGALPGCTRPSAARLVDEAVGRLAGGSLLTFSGEGDSVVAAHRLTMRVVRERGMREGTLEPLGTRACSLLASVVEVLGDPWEDRAAARDLIGQVTSLHRHLLPCLDGAPALAAELLSLRGTVLGWLNGLGDALAGAVEQGRSYLPIASGSWATIITTLSTRSSLAFAYQEGGRPMTRSGCTIWTASGLPAFNR